MSVTITNKLLLESIQESTLLKAYISDDMRRREFFTTDKIVMRKTTWKDRIQLDYKGWTLVGYGACIEKNVGTSFHRIIVNGDSHDVPGIQTEQDRYEYQRRRFYELLETLELKMTSVQAKLIFGYDISEDSILIVNANSMYPWVKGNNGYEEKTDKGAIIPLDIEKAVGKMHEIANELQKVQRADTVKIWSPNKVTTKKIGGEQE